MMPGIFQHAGQMGRQDEIEPPSFEDDDDEDEDFQLARKNSRRITPGGGSKASKTGNQITDMVEGMSKSLTSAMDNKKEDGD